MWVVAHEKVYDVTSFLPHHPGSAKAILRKAGMDCTVDFGFHTSKTRRRLWPQLVVGKVVPCSSQWPESKRRGGTLPCAIS